jgi:hypothetical protein
VAKLERNIGGCEVACWAVEREGGAANWINGGANWVRGGVQIWPKYEGNN